MARYIGCSVPRREDPRLLRGEGRFVGDIALPGTLAAAFVRSSHAHAHVNGVVTAPALAVSGVHGCFTAADLGAYNEPLPVFVPAPDPKLQVTQRPLAQDRVRYVGEALACVVADDPYVAEDAAEAVLVEYEPLTAVVDPQDALASGSALIHPGAGSNAVGSYLFERGHVQDAFARASLVVEDRFHVTRGAGVPMETRGVLAHYEPATETLTMWTSTQTPHLVRREVARRLGWAEHRVRVIAPDVGGGFGSKRFVYPEEVVVAVLAYTLRRPVRWLEDRREHFLCTVQERGQVHEAALAVDADGRILALRDRFWHDGGAYAPFGIHVPMITLVSLTGPYVVPAIRGEFTCAFTNKVPVVPIRGAGQPQACFVMERLLDLAARRLGMDAAEIRRRNLAEPEKLPYDKGITLPGFGQVVLDSGDYPACLERLLQEMEYADLRRRQREMRIQGRYVGVGLTCYVETSGSGPFEGVRVRVEPTTGKVMLFTGSASQGQGHETVLAQVCAGELGVDLEDVQVVGGDTALIPYGTGTWGSRTAALAGTAAGMAAREVRQQALEVAAAILEVSPADLDLVGGQVQVRGVPGRGLSLVEVARAAGRLRGQLPVADRPGLEFIRYFSPPAPAYSYGSHGAVVELDPETGMVKILRYVAVHDCGTELNPMIVEGQVVGGVIQGIGSALYEEMVHDQQGQPLTATLMDYLVPTASEAPPVQCAALHSPTPHNPYGIKGAGEGGIVPAAAAIAAAVEDALSHLKVTIRSVPIKPDACVRLYSGSSRGKSTMSDYTFRRADPTEPGPGNGV